MPALRSPGPCSNLSADEFRRQMEVNVIGPIIATQAFGPLLGSDPSLKGPKGRIVMISSVAGRNGNPLTAAYSASKHAIEGLSESLRRELMLFGIDVIIVAPGAVKTPIWSKAGGSRYLRLQELALSSGAAEGPRLHAAPRRDRTCRRRRSPRTIFEALTLPNPKVRYQIAPDPMRHLMAAVLPKRMVDKIIAKRLGLMPPG